MRAKIGDEWIESVVLLTRDSAGSEIARAIHDRMRVTFAARDAQRARLDPKRGAEDALCGTLPAECLSARPAKHEVNHVGSREAGATGGIGFQCASEEPRATDC